MTVSDLIDYLGQFDGDTRVFLSEFDAGEFEGDYVLLESAFWLDRNESEEVES